jgi:hypothetical protein
VSPFFFTMLNPLCNSLHAAMVLQLIDAHPPVSQRAFLRADAPRKLPEIRQNDSQSESAEAAQASVLGEQKAVTTPTELTLSDAWSRYFQCQSFLQKAAKTRLTETGYIQPVLAELGAYSLQSF